MLACTGSESVTSSDLTTGVITPSTSEHGDATTGDTSAGPNGLVTDEPGGTQTGSGSGATSWCGNGRVEWPEECDDGDEVYTDACLPTCEAARCGDGVTWAGVEECDDQNHDNLDGCTNACELAECGDGLLQPWEDCDDGDHDDDDACTAKCNKAVCGDGFVWQGKEACDAGGEAASCDDDCTPPACGDGNLNAAAGEACDDGNLIPNDSCTLACEHAECGDGLLWAGVEECDDGNFDPDDGCANDCTLPPKYTAIGPQQDVPQGLLEGWETCWSEPYGATETETVTQLLQESCTRAHVMLACRAVGSNVYKVLAHGPRDAIIEHTEGDDTHVVNGARWYYSSGESWGFAGLSDTVQREPCDVETENGARRLCWNLNQGAIAKGFRCGTAQSLNNSNIWERVLLHAY